MGGGKDRKGARDAKGPGNFEGEACAVGPSERCGAGRATRVADYMPTGEIQRMSPVASLVTNIRPSAENVTAAGRPCAWEPSS